MYLSYVNEAYRDWEQLYQLLSESSCYVCSLRCQLEQTDPKKGVMGRKFGYFLSDSVLFMAKERNEAEAVV